MRFEFDPVKNQSNKKKHGIDFIEAQVIWFGSFLEVPLESDTEQRYAVIGQIEGSLWTAIITYREERIRIISVRRSRAEEKSLYEKKAKAHYR